MDGELQKMRELTVVYLKTLTRNSLPRTEENVTRAGSQPEIHTTHVTLRNHLISGNAEYNSLFLV